MKFYDVVEKLLKQDERFVAEDGTILKNAVYEAAMNMDTKLIKALLSNEDTKTQFFKEIDGIMVFDKVGFGWMVNNRQFLPDSYTRFKNKIGLTDEAGDMIATSGRVELLFPYKDCVLEGGQTKEDQKRNEIFYNSSLAPDEIDRLLFPKVMTNAKKYDENGVSSIEDVSEADNYIIKGNNILSLSSLLKTKRGKVQFIYIDPPYNTSNDSFRYNDSFKRSTWLTFMKNRLELAKQLLKSSGTIAISINYIELSYLKVMCDEIFGEENYINTVTIKTATTASFRAINDCPVNVSEFILIYAKNKSAAKINPVYVTSDYSEDYGSYIKNFDESIDKWEIVSVDSVIYEAEGVNTWQEYRDKYGEGWKQVRYEKKAKFCLENCDRVVSLNTMQKPSQDIVNAIEESKANRGVVYEVRGNYIYNGRSLAFYKKKLREIDGTLTPTEILTNVWTDISFLSLGNEGGVDLPNGKKPEKLIQRLLSLYTDKDDLILDYHVGSGTTCAVAHKMGRQYIGCEQLDYGKNDSVVRLKNVIDGEQGGISKAVGWNGGGSFVYCELAKSNMRYVDEIQEATSTSQINDIYSRIIATGFISSRVNPKSIDENGEEFGALSLDDQKRFLMELLDMNLLYVNYCDIDDEEYNISDSDKSFTRSFYGEV